MTDNFDHMVILNGDEYTVFPTYEEFLEIRSSVPDSSLEEVCILHNTVIDSLRKYLETDEYRCLFDGYKSICQKMGYSFPQLQRDVIVSQYFEFVFGSEIVSPQENYDLGIRLSLGKNIPEKLQKLPYSKDLLRYKTYDDAVNRYQWFIHKIYQDEELTKLIQKLHRDVLPTARKLFHEPVSGDLKPFQCQFCKEFSAVVRNSGVNTTPRHCGKAECIKKYEAWRKAQQRTIRKSKAQDFVKASDKPQLCMGECGGKRLLNSSGLCKQCFAKSLIDQ